MKMYMANSVMGVFCFITFVFLFDNKLDDWFLLLVGIMNFVIAYLESKEKPITSEIDKMKEK